MPDARMKPRCLAFSEHPDDHSDNDAWALVCDLTRGHLGLHRDQRRHVRWMHEVPLP